MSTSVTFRALAPAPRAALTAPGARRRAAAPRAPARRGDALARTASRKRRKQKGGSGGDVDAIVAPRSEAEAEAEAPPASPSSSSSPSPSSAPPPARGVTAPSQPLPVATRDDVLDSCYGTTFWLLALGAGAREGAHFGQGILPAFVSDWTADLPLIAALHPPSSPALVATHAGVALGVAAAVTAARRALLGASPEFREATNRSNAQVLRPLRAGDVVTVSLLPAVAEETAFRGVLLPALIPVFGGSTAAAYGAVVASGAVFGALHAGGGRNAAFAAWASLVGVAYGAAAVATGDVATAMLAHALANYASATLWLRDDAEASIV